MARLFTCGFEENDLAATMWSAVSGPATISTVRVHSGTYALRVQAAGSTAYALRLLGSSVTSGTVFLRFYLYMEALPAATVDFVTCRNDGGGSNYALQMLATGVLRLVNSVSAGTFDSTALSADVWYRIEVRHLLSDTVGQLEVRIYTGESTTADQTFGDGNFSGGDGSDADTLNTNVQRWYFGQFTSTQTWDFYYDDLAINNAIDPGDGSQMTWCGPGKTVLLTPDGDNAVAWTKSGSAPAGTNFGGVAEVPGTPDDGTTYNEDSGTTNVDRLDLSAMPAEVTADAVIALADVSARVSAGAASQTAILRLWDEGGALVDGASIALGNGTWAFTTTAQHLVKNCAGKTKANLNSFSAGYKGNTGASAKRVSALWVNVEWLESAVSNTNITPPTMVRI